MDWTIFLDHFFGGGARLTISTLGSVGCSLSAFRDGRQTVVPEGGVEDEPSVRREGWEVYV